MLTEGGNVFRDEQGEPMTQRIDLADIRPTVAWLETVTDLPLLDNMLGSTGLKPTSGDLDLAVDSTKVDKERFFQQLTNMVQQRGEDPRRWVRKSGTAVHLLTPIGGKPGRGFVQTDFMFLPKPEFSKWILRGDPQSDYKGATRNILINSMAKSLGYKLNQIAGIADRATNELISDDPDDIARMLLNPAATREDLASVERILAALRADPQREAKLADFRDHMQRAGTPLDESMGYTDVNWMARLRDRIANLGMVPIMEDRNPRIPYIEDLVFQKGIAGVRDALAIIDDTAQNTQQYATQKWDGCVHPDTKVLTSQGIMRIEDLIDHVNQSQSLTVLAHNFALFADEQVNVSDAIKKYGIKEWVEIVFESGETIKLTKDHPVFTNNRGWVLAEDLTNDDDVKHVKCD